MIVLSGTFHSFKRALSQTARLEKNGHFFQFVSCNPPKSFSVVTILIYFVFCNRNYYFDIFFNLKVIRKCLKISRHCYFKTTQWKKYKQKTKFAIILIFLKEYRTYVDPPNIASACALMFSRSIPEKTMFIAKLV